MGISYNGLWKMLIDRKMKKTDLIDQLGISSGTLAKMGKGEEVSLSVLSKICEKYDCDYGDIISYEKSDDCAMISIEKMERINLDGNQ